MNQPTRRASCAALAVFCLVGLAAAAPWQHPLYLDGGDYSRGRIAVTVHNDADRAAEGEPVPLKIGSGPSEAALVGMAAEAVRVCDPAGEEMLFALADPLGTPILRGPIPAGSTLLIPAECAPHKTAAYYIYYNNPSAGEVPDLLSARLDVSNGDMEAGDGAAPANWEHDAPDAGHRATTSEEQPQSGKRCLKTVVDDGAEPTWIATRQREIRIVGGARYVMKAWVRAENVKGMAGWYIHVGNRKNPMSISPMLIAGEGTFAWKEVSAQFTAPAEADLADLGTVLRGTGVAWFDHVTLQCLDPSKLRAVAEKPESLRLRETGADAPWRRVESSPNAASNQRAAVKVFNLSSETLAQPLASVEISMLAARMRGRLDRANLVVAHDGRPVPHFFCGDLLLFKATLAARSVQTYYVYFSESARRDASSPAASGRLAEREATATVGYAALIAGDHNLVKNPGFEQGDKLPDAWTTSGSPPAEGVTFAVEDPGKPGFGKRCAKMHVPEKAPSNWRGWRQDVPVRPRRTYLLAAAVKCANVRSGEVRLHAHRHDANGQLCKQEPMVGAGPGITGSADWTLMSGLFAMPEDAATFCLHLTTDRSGTVWHDNVLVAEVVPGALVRLEQRPAPESAEVQVWPVPAIVKVFADDGPPAQVAAARISAARNEKEPLQLAIRSAKAIRGVRVEVDAPAGPQGATLSDLEINAVGYVPIDHPTSYFQSQTPAWHRKYPRGGGQSDGWAGLWPDPLLPRSTFDLAAGATQSIWITVGVGKDAPAGEYTGKVRLVGDGKPLATIRFSVRVWDFALPDESHLKAIYDVGLGDGEKFWKKPASQAYPEIAEFMARRRLCPNMIDPSPVFKYENGRATADFSAFDKAATRYFDQWKLPHAYTPWEFYLFGWGFPPKEMFGERPYAGDPPYEKADRSRLRPEYRKAYQSCLRLFWEHVKQKGWQKRFVLYISDEPFFTEEPIRKQMKALCEMIHEVDRQIPIYSSTWHHVPDWDGYLDIWGIGHYGVVSPEKMAQIRAGGARLWFTTDGQMCTDTPYCAVERLLPHYCFRYGAEAYEFWSVAWLTYDPYRFGWHAYIHQTDAPGKSYWVRYPNGDGFLLYPGAPVGHAGPVSSIRFEQAREGVEDYEYLHLLRRLAREAKVAGKDAAQADRALDLASRLVPIPNAGGRYATKILPDPEAVYEAKEAFGKAIERLAR